MKLIPLTILLIVAVDVKAQNYRKDFPFPPQFQTPNVGMFTSDSSLYLPPESHTALPFFMKNMNMNNLQFPLLPPGAKAPSMFPTPYPLVISTTLVPNFDDDDDDEDSGRIRLASPPPPPKPQPLRVNQTENAPESPKEQREMRSIPKMYQQPIPIQNRNDVKFPFKMPAQPPTVTITNPVTINPTPATRRMIIGSETQRSDFDQVKAPSFLQGPQFLPAGPGIYVSSTTEPAIPILRLSNEMDLDGSFSYEALGADQTHYVQHSRMENMGTDQQEQVVEGSYSYVGDNGHTYTVHYVADSNGFRASGDHLPVAPPMPEIIQRAVQYNLAEEAKKPPHLKSWQDDGRENEVRDSSDKNQQFSLPPTRNFFTGRTPEAFSYSFSQGSNTGNNLVTAASNQAPVKTVDYTTEQTKVNNAPISPQITFLASQGAHLPSMNTVQNQISRMFTTEKPVLHQIVNYEAQIKGAEQEPNTGLWRWQYGINANNLNQNPTKETISRSSGDGDDIMINFGEMSPEQYTKMIRSQFEYSPDNAIANQLTQSLQSNDDQLSQNLENNNDKSNYQSSQNSPHKENYHVQNLENQYIQNLYDLPIYTQNHKPQETQNYQSLEINQKQNNYKTKENVQNEANQNNNLKNFQHLEASKTNPPQNGNSNEYSIKSETNGHPSLSTVTAYSQLADSNKQTLQYNQVHSASKPVESRKLISGTSKILTHKDFVFPTQTVTQSYDFDEDTFYEPRKIKSLNTEGNSKPAANTLNQVQNNFDKSVSFDSHWTKNEFEIKESTTQEPYISTVRDLKFTDFIVQESKSDFRPISTTTTTEAPRQETTTKNLVEDILENNIFLKNLLNPTKSENKQENFNAENYLLRPIKSDNKVENFDTENYQKEDEIVEQAKKVEQPKVEAEPKTEKIHKIVQYQPKPVNDLKVHKKKPVDIADILNYVSMKNHFESSKVKPKGRIVGNNFDQRNEIRFIPIQQEREENEVHVPEQRNNFRTINTEHQEELRGLIKNYKVLQRNNNNVKHNNGSLKTELSPPPLKSPSLPPLGRAGPSMKSYLPPIYV